MKRSKRIAGAVLLTLCFLPAGFAEQAAVLPKEAMELIRKADALKSYRVNFLLEAKEEDGEQVRLSGTIAFKRPNLRRVEVRQEGDKEMSQTIVSDGTAEWHYYPATAALYKVEVPADIPGPHHPFGEAELESLRFIGVQGESLDLRLRFEGKPTDVVKEGAPMEVEKIRIDIGQADGLVRELSLINPAGTAVFTQRYTDVETDKSFQPSEFQFTPPEGVPIIEPGSLQEEGR